MKTILQWLEEAKEQGYDWADAAIRNYDPNFVTIKETNSLIDALGNAFAWGGSPEKYEYWEKIQGSLASQAQPPQPPQLLTDLVARYEAARLGLDRVLPDKSLREPHRTASYAAYMASYQEDMKEVIEQISDTLGLTDKYYALQKEFEAHKATAEELNRSYINEHNENYDRMMKIEQLEKELEAVRGKKLIGWVVANEFEQVYLVRKPEKVKVGWNLTEPLTPEEAMELCGRVPKWSDDEPIPVYEK